MHDARIARRYAQALFTTAVKFDVVKAVEGDLNAISRLIETDKSFRDFVMAPYTSREEKAKIAERVFGDRITALDGQAMAETCVRHGLGVLNATVSVDFVDADFFAELTEG